MDQDKNSPEKFQSNLLIQCGRPYRFTQQALYTSAIHCDWFYTHVDN